MIKFLIDKFNELFPPPVEFTEKDERELLKRVLKRYAQGSISLYRGKFITTQDLSIVKSRISSHNFSQSH